MSVFAPLICDSTGHLSTVTKCIYFLFTVSLWTKCCFISMNMVESNLFTTLSQQAQIVTIITYK